MPLFGWGKLPEKPKSHYIGYPSVSQDGKTVSTRAVDLDAMVASKEIDIVDIGDSSILVVEAPSHVMQRKQLVDADAKDLQMGIELGRSATSWSRYIREEYNPELRDQAGLIKYDRMRRSDAAVRGALKTLKTPILGATWYIQPFDDTKKHKDIAAFVNRNLTQYMTYSWESVVREALLMLDFGFWLSEKVWDFREVDGKRMVYLRKLASRHPLDVVDWGYDENGGPAYVDLYNAPGQSDHARIPIKKLAIYTYDGEAGDMRGISILRSAYKHWYFKENLYKIDAIQKERHGIGIPVIKLPPGFTPDDRAKAHELGENLRSNEKAHVVLPPYWELMFAKLEGQPVSALESAAHHTEMIYANVLSQAMYNAVTGGNAEAMMELFYKSTRHIADIVRSVFNKYIIPQIVGMNWGIDDYPELKIRRLGDTQEARTISFALRNMVGANIIQVDDALEDWARDLMDAPMPDPTTRRAPPVKPGTTAPQAPKVGPPRQAPAAGGMQQGRQSGAANSGTDHSGSR